MSIPTPAILKKQLDEKRASETTQQAEIVSKRRSSRASSGTTAPERPNHSGKTTSSSTPTVSNSSSKKPSKPLPKKPFERTEHLTQKPLRDNPDLQKLQEEFKEMEAVNKKAGWYDRDRNGKQTKAQQTHATKLAQTVQKLRDAIGESNIVDIGKGAETALGVSAARKTTAIKLLMDEGFKRFYIQAKQKGTEGKRVTLVVLTAPGTTFKSVVTRQNEIIRLKSPFVTRGERALSMHEAGYSNAEIGEALKINESSVRSLLAIAKSEKENN